MKPKTNAKYASIFAKPKTKTYNVNVGEAVHAGRRFRPQGKLRCYEKGRATNPATRISGGGYSARLFVGLKVGQKVKWKIGDVIRIVRRVRKEQGKPSDASILAQHGIYEDRRGKLVVEPSVQVIIIDLTGEPKKTFLKDMQELAEELREALRQETVILEIQQRGVVRDVYSVTG